MNDKCPNCGADITWLTICTNPPIHVKQCNNCGWREEEKEQEQGE